MTTASGSVWIDIVLTMGKLAIGLQSVCMTIPDVVRDTTIASTFGWVVLHLLSKDSSGKCTSLWRALSPLDPMMVALIEMAIEQTFQ